MLVLWPDDVPLLLPTLPSSFSLRGWLDPGAEGGGLGGSFGTGGNDGGGGDGGGGGGGDGGGDGRGDGGTPNANDAVEPGSKKALK